MSTGFSHIDIAGEKIRLRIINEADAKMAYQLVKNDAVLINLAWDGPTDKEELLGIYRQWEEEMRTGESCNLTIERADQPGLIGSIGIRFHRNPQQADIGYWLDEKFWNKGYMTEAVRLACHLTFRYCDAVRAYATVFTGNTGSRRALEKNGFSLDGTMRCHVNKRGNWLDCWFFSLLRSEWEDKRDYYVPKHEDIQVVAGEE